MCKLKEEAKKQTLKRVLQFASREAGGILEATSAGALPHSRQQIKDARRESANKHAFDPFYSVVFMCKAGEGVGEDSFIRMVNVVPLPMMFLAFDYMPDDLVHFCTSPNTFSIHGIDPTFSLGDFDVTVTTYHHLLLHPHGNPDRKPSVMFRPMFIHVRKDFATYNFFLSSLAGQRPKLSSLRVFGTDSEVALEVHLQLRFLVLSIFAAFYTFEAMLSANFKSFEFPTLCRAK